MTTEAEERAQHRDNARMTSLFTAPISPARDTMAVLKELGVPGMEETRDLMGVLSSGSQVYGGLQTMWAADPNSRDHGEADRRNGILGAGRGALGIMGSLYKLTGDDQLSKYGSVAGSAMEAYQGFENVNDDSGTVHGIDKNGEAGGYQIAHGIMGTLGTVLPKGPAQLAAKFGTAGLSLGNYLNTQVNIASQIRGDYGVDPFAGSAERGVDGAPPRTTMMADGTSDAASAGGSAYQEACRRLYADYHDRGISNGDAIDMAEWRATAIGGVSSVTRSVKNFWHGLWGGPEEGDRPAEAGGVRESDTITNWLLDWCGPSAGDRARETQAGQDLNAAAATAPAAIDHARASGATAPTMEVLPGAAAGRRDAAVLDALGVPR